MRTLCLSILGTLAAAVLPASAAETLTVYTYESFTAEWGPGPQVEKAFEAECGCDLKFVSVADGVALLNRVKLEGQSTKADIVLGLDTNLTADAKATGLFAPAGIDQSALAVPGGWSDDTFVPFDYGYFAVVYDTEKVTDAAEKPRGAGRWRPQYQDRHRGSAHVDAWARAGAVGEGGLRRSRGRCLGEAEAARAHRDARLERGLRPVHQGRGADGAVLHDIAGLPHHRRGHRALPGGRIFRKATICRSRWPA